MEANLNNGQCTICGSQCNTGGVCPTPHYHNIYGVRRDQLTIGQSLTPDQVRNLPDGAKAMMRHFRGEDVEWINLPGFQSASQIADMMESGTFIGAVLVSLPSEQQKREIPKPVMDDLVLRSVPSEPQGYLAQRVWQGPSITELLDSPTGHLAVPSEPSPGEGYKVDKYRRRIEPQAEPALRVSEIEKEAAKYLLSKYCVLGDLYGKKAEECRDYLRAYEYALSIGAIE